mmetsp:Transcript_23670/g.47997  ORF Transcript_23670/g.47997 Transcript_23670/m.47997 type:complete len:203 (-) Transcript_23670:778-1386(-)
MKESKSPASSPILGSQGSALLLVTLLYALTNGLISLIALTTSELTAATLASLGRCFSPSRGSLWIAFARFSNVLAVFLTVVRCMAIQRLPATDAPGSESSLVPAPFPRSCDMSHSLARDGPSIRTPSSMRRPAAAAEALARMFSGGAAPSSPAGGLACPPAFASFRKTVSMTSMQRSTTTDTTWLYEATSASLYSGLTLAAA